MSPNFVELELIQIAVLWIKWQGFHSFIFETSWILKLQRKYCKIPSISWTIFIVKTFAVQVKRIQRISTPVWQAERHRQLHHHRNSISFLWYCIEVFSLNKDIFVAQVAHFISCIAKYHAFHEFPATAAWILQYFLRCTLIRFCDLLYNEKNVKIYVLQKWILFKRLFFQTWDYGL